jgi:hypothetical protein
MSVLASALDTPFTPAAGDFSISVRGGSAILLAAADGTNFVPASARIANCVVLGRSGDGTTVFKLGADGPAPTAVRVDQ